ncbi:MAG: thiol peroxidase [Odoribacter sp.]
MTTVTFVGTKVNLNGTFPKVGSQASEFKLVKSDLKELSLSDLKGKKVVLNIFPSLDTKVCAMSVRNFNRIASEMKNTIVLAISKDLPFAHARFCTTEGIENLTGLSAFRNLSFGEEYGVDIVDGPLAGLLARAVIILDEQGKIIYTELVPEITHEPNYEAALKILK